MNRDPQPNRRGLPTAGVAVPSDRRFRRADAPPVRRRRAVRMIWSITRWLTGAIAVGVIATWGAQRLVASDMFLVREISVRGNERLSIGEVEVLLAGLRDENVLLVDFDHYRQRVMDSSWVDQVTLSRVLPATIVVEVVERTPMVVARFDQQLYMVDRTGRIIDEYRAEHRGFELPIVDGLLTAAAGEKAGADPDRMRLTARLCDELDARADLRQRLSQVDVANPRDVVVMFDDDSAWLHLGDAAFTERLQRYLDLRPVLLDRFGAIDYADLKFDARIYVRGQGQRTPASVATR